MAPFRWPSMLNDIALAKEVAARKPQTHNDWEEIALVLSEAFSTTEKKIKLTGRSCREHMDRLLEKQSQEDKKALKKSATEEEYGELSQLLDDILIYTRDMKEIKEKEALEKQNKKNKEAADKMAGTEMRRKAMEGLPKRKCSTGSSSDDDDSSDMDSYCTSGDGTAAKAKKDKVKKKRASRLSAVEMLEKKNERKANLKEKELVLRAEELELQRRRFEEEAAERKDRMQLELEERRIFLQALKDRL